MYANDITNFENKTDDLLTELNLKFWFCCNGKVSGISDIINKFVRCEKTAKLDGGNDDGEVFLHNHGTLGNGGISHSHTLYSTGTAHTHTSTVRGIITSSGTHSWLLAGNFQDQFVNYNTTTNGAHTHTIYSAGNHSHTLNNPTGSVDVTGGNMPYYKTLLFIKRKR